MTAMRIWLPFTAKSNQQRQPGDYSTVIDFARFRDLWLRPEFPLTFATLTLAYTANLALCRSLYGDRFC